VQKEGRVFADEIDFLGTYLENGLNMGNLQEQNMNVSLTGMSAPIDNFYSSADAGVESLKPEPKLSPYFSKLILAMEERAFPNWSTVAVDVLRSAVFEEQIKLDKALAELRSKVERNRADPKKECCLVVRSHALKDAALLFLAFPPKLFPQRHDMAREVAAQVFEDARVKRCVVVLRDTSRWDDPYSSVFVLRRPRDS
jgi:hypothetical protein